jgi:hypothetical protein
MIGLNAVLGTMDVSENELETLGTSAVVTLSAARNLPMRVYMCLCETPNSWAATRTSDWGHRAMAASGRTISARRLAVRHTSSSTKEMSTLPSGVSPAEQHSGTVQFIDQLFG